VDVFDRKLQILERGGWFSDVRRTRTAIDRLMPTIRAAADHVTRDLYISRAAKVSGVPRETLVEEAARSARAGRSGAPAGTPPTPGDDRERPRAREILRDGDAAERALVQAMLLARDRAEEITEAIGRIDDEAADDDKDAPATLRDPRLVAIQQAVLAAPDDDPAQLSEGLSDDATRLLDELQGALDGIVNLDATIDDSLRQLKARWRRERIAALRAATGIESDTLNAETLRLKLEIQQLTLRPSRGAPD
jgi:DNA primase